MEQLMKTLLTSSMLLVYGIMTTYQGHIQSIEEANWYFNSSVKFFRNLNLDDKETIFNKRTMLYNGINKNESTFSYGSCRKESSVFNKYADKQATSGSQPLQWNENSFNKKGHQMDTLFIEETTPVQNNIHSDRVKGGATSKNELRGSPRNDPFVDGYVGKVFVERDSFLFPVGDERKTREPEAGPTVYTETADVITAAYFFERPTISHDAFIQCLTDGEMLIAPELQAVSNIEFWDLDGSSENIRLRLPWDADSDVSAMTSDINNIVITAWDGIMWVNLKGEAVGDLAGNGSVITTLPEGKTLSDYCAYTIAAEFGHLIDQTIPGNYSNKTFFEIKVFLQGPYNKDIALMNDDLRVLALLPAKEPYQELIYFDKNMHPFVVKGRGGETVTDSLAVFGVEGKNAIVDWIFLELRDALNPREVIATRSALLQRDGDIVEIDGISKLRFDVPEGNYYLAVRHRNHLGVMTEFPLIIGPDMIHYIDFTSLDAATYKLQDSLIRSDYSQKLLNNVHMMWSGNSNMDNMLIFSGPNLDSKAIFFPILTAAENGRETGQPDYNHTLITYHEADTNMDGYVRYQGQKNDIDMTQFMNILSHPENESLYPNMIMYEQIPH